MIETRTTARSAGALLEAFHDHEKFCRESLSIRDKRGHVVPFELQPAQKKLHEAIARQRAARKPVRIVYLKPRRVMVSAAVAAEFFHEIPFNAGQQGLVVAHSLKAARQIWNYHRDFHRLYKPFGGVIELPQAVRRPGLRGAIEYENGSTIEIETARNLDAGRAFSLRYLQLSEYAYYPNARRIGAGLLNAVPDDLDTMVIKESTANGIGNPFYLDCLSAQDATAGDEWLFVFFPWWEHPEYTMPFATPEDAGRFQQSLTRDEQAMRERFGLRLEQMQWRRWAIRAKCEGSGEMFRQEYPATPEEAFLYSGRPRFNHAQLKKMPVTQGAPAGELVERVTGPRAVIHFEPRERGPLAIYKRPQVNRLYVAGIDVSHGIDVGDGTIGGSDPDYSVMSVFDKDTGEQVAKLRGRIEPDPFGEYCVQLGRWYNWAFLVPEADGPGLALISALLRYGYPPSFIFHRQPRADEQFSSNRGTSTQMLGWSENVVTRQQLISELDAEINNLGILLHDPNTIAEHFSFVIKANGRAEHQGNCHDDEVFATGLAVQGLKHPPIDRRIADAARGPQPGHVNPRQYGQSREESQRRGRLVRL